MTDNTKTNYYHILDIPTRLLSDLIRSIKLNDTQRRALVGSLIWGQPVSGSKIRSIRLDDTQADALVGSLIVAGGLREWHTAATVADRLGISPEQAVAALNRRAVYRLGRGTQTLQGEWSGPPPCTISTTRGGVDHWRDTCHSRRSGFEVLSQPW